MRRIATSRFVGLDARVRTANSISTFLCSFKEWEQLTRIFFRLHASQAFMIRIRCACSLCSLVFVPRPAEEVTSTPSLVMMEKPGKRASAAFLVSFIAFLVTRRGAVCVLVGGVMLMDPYPESARVIEEAGDGV